MSALGQKRTLQSVRPMSALPQKRTMIKRVGMSRFVSKADIVYDRAPSGRSIHRWRRPRTLENFVLGPVRADVQRELVSRGRHPIRILVRTRRRILEIERERAVSVLLHRLAFGPKRKAIEFIRLKKMLLVVDSE